jgi:hypothetical protein
MAMNRKHRLVSAGILLAGALTVFFALQGAVSGQKCRIIRIQQERGSAGTAVRIEPQTTHISRDTCVIWINWVPKQEVRVIFREDGKRCQDATDSPMGFSMAEDYYVTSFIPLGGTSSLKFNDEGTFSYEVEVPSEPKATGPSGLEGGEVKGKGTIVVE